MEVRSFEDLERRLVAWAEEREDVRTMLVVGSRARPESADEWSDLDVAFSTTEPERYRKGVEWLDSIAEVWLAFVDPDDPTRHVLFAGGFDAGITPLSHRSVQLLPRAVRFRGSRAYAVVPDRVRGPVDRRLDALTTYLRRGARVVVDKDGAGAEAVAALPPAATPEAPEAPEAPDLLHVQRELFFVAVWTAKHLRRGELWLAKERGIDGRMKELLREVIEWHASGPGTGRRLEEWAGPAVLEEVRGTFARYDEDDLWRALFATVDLFRRLAKETAERLGLPYDDEADRTVTEWLVRCEAERRSG